MYWAGYYYCRIQHNLCVVGEMTRERLEDWTTSKKIFLRPGKHGVLRVFYTILPFPSVVDPDLHFQESKNGSQK
jgi:hypothetical protein